jgi:hypothetical protein
LRQHAHFFLNPARALLRYVAVPRADNGDTTDVLLLYPGESLSDQLGIWARRYSDRHVETSFERSLPEIRRLLRRAGTVVIDASEDPSQATDAFLQAVTQLGASAVTMYTERMHDDLEMFVRLRGSLFILGPLFEQQWDELLERSLRTKDSESATQRLMQQRQHSVDSNSHRERLRARFVNRFRVRLDWPFTDSN